MASDMAEMLLPARRVLMIGGMPPPVGGTTVLFKNLIDGLQQTPSLSVTLINTSRLSQGLVSTCLQGLLSLVKMIHHIASADVVSFHASMQGALLFGPFVHIFCRVFRKKWIFRAFGGCGDEWYQSIGPVRRFLCRSTVFSADAVLLERQSSVRFFRALTKSAVHWYPNSRKIDPAIQRQNGSEPRGGRFVYVGHVKPSKGIPELMEACKLLRTENVRVDVYGPMQEGITESTFDQASVTYCGLLANERVVSTLQGYDALLLPTYWKGEGYPGVILEAYCAGIPVIATRWGGIPEIVTSETGILVEPRDVEGLARAMRQIMTSEALRARLRAGARQKATEFDAEQWTTYFIRLCEGLTAGRRG